MKTLLGLVSAVLLGASAAGAQENFYRVYRYETPLAGWAEPALWTAFVPRSDVTERDFGATRAREGLWAHSTELEFGVSDHLSLAAYADFIDPPGAGSRFAQGRLEARYRFAQAYEHWIDTALYAEFYMPRSGYSGTQHLELRAILQKDVEDFRVVLNPLLSFNTHGRYAGGSPEVGLQSGVYYRRSRVLQPGLEFYANFGRSGRWEDQRYVAMPVVDVLLGRRWTWHVGAGRRVSGHGDEWIVESVLQFSWNAMRPRRWFSGQ